MKTPSLPANETQRLMTLRDLDILDTLPEESFDRITRIARRVFGVPIAVVALMDSERQWFKSIQGLGISEVPREKTFCAHAIADDDLLVVSDATKDERFHDNPFVLNDPSVRFYAGMPVRSGGHAVGTLCLLDRQPREFTEDDIATLRDLTAMVEDELRGLSTATTDPLTKISNRRGFEMLAIKTLAVSSRLGGTASLLLFDLDGFKSINDELGHAVGDQALVDFAQTLVRTFRDADVIARLGGDEFCVLALAPAVALSAPLTRLRDNLAAIANRPYRLAFSVGIAEYAADRHASPEALVADADRAMYEAKAARRR